jgi:hypothetical protein
VQVPKQIETKATSKKHLRFYVLSISSVKIRAEVIARENPLLAPQTLYLEQSVALQRSLECSCARKTSLQSSVIVIAELTTGDYFGGWLRCTQITWKNAYWLHFTLHEVDFKSFWLLCRNGIDDTMKGVVKQRLLSKLSSLSEYAPNCLSKINAYITLFLISIFSSLQAFLFCRVSSTKCTSR